MAAAARNKKDAPGRPQASWRRLGGGYLLTNDSGAHAWLGERDFRKVIEGKLAESSPAYPELVSKGFVRNRMDFTALSAQWKKLNSHLDSGPGLHILVLTLRCNHKCLYCQSAAAGEGARGTDMDLATARKSVDFAFRSPNPGITIEFQGGEPLLNWGVLKKTVEYARRKAAASGKELKIALVSNFSLMDEAKARFLLENEVSICTSLDGPADLHNRNRIYSGGNSHAGTVKWLRYFQKRNRAQGPGYRVFKPSALLTVSRYSLSRSRDIIDEYVKLGLEDIFVRPLAPIGYAKGLWDKIGYTSAEFSAFYLESLDYILALNRRGVRLREKAASLMLEKILNHSEPGYLDSRCPCGAAIGQLAYNYNGDIYTCDEGRMVGWEGDDLFRIGTVDSAYKSVVSGAGARACAISSNLEAQPACFRCAYKPYCGVCPVYNYSAQGSLWGNMPASGRCALSMGVLDAVFLKLKDKKSGATLREWVKK